MAPNYNLLMQGTLNGASNIMQTNMNGGKVDTGSVVEYAANLLTQFFCSLGDNEDAVDDETKKANDIDKSAKTTTKATDKKVAEFDEETKKLTDKINKNLETVEEKNKKRLEIEKSLQEQLDIIEKAKNTLNTSKNGSERVAAINELRGAQGVIKGLVADSTSLVAEIESGVQEIQDYEQEITEVSDEAEEAQEEGAEKLYTLSEEGASLIQKSAGTARSGEQEITQGEIKAAAGTATTMFGGSTEAAEGAAMIAEGTYTVGKTAINIGMITKTSGQISSDLVKIAESGAKIGQASADLTSLTEQIQSSWGVLGIWAQGYSDTLEGEQEAFGQAIDKADEQVNCIEQYDNTDNNGNITNESTLNQEETDHYASLAYEKESIDISQTFTYDVNNLKGLLSEKQ